MAETIRKQEIPKLEIPSAGQLEQYNCNSGEDY